MSPGAPPSNLRSGSNMRGGGRNDLFHKNEVSDLFDRLTSIENLLDAWELFKTGKRKRPDVMRFEKSLEDNLFQLRDDLISGRYRHNPYEPFTIHDPKQRTIHKAVVKDRVVHQAVINVIEPLFERRFIFDSYSCRINKGTHAAVTRLRSFLRSATRNGTTNVYAVKCDVKKFFASVDHSVLMRLLCEQISDQKMIALLRMIVESFSVTPNVGLPLGNLTSQLFANVYLHELDWHIKQRMRVRHYLRYCDDFVMLAPSMQQAMHLAEQADGFLHNALNMQLHPNKVRVRTWRQGVDFLGYVVLPNAVILRPQTAKRAVRCITPENATSYLGLCSHADAFELSCLLRNKAGI